MATLVAGSALRTRLALKAHRAFADAFVCRRCLQHQAYQSKALRSSQSIRDNPFLTAFRNPPRHSRAQSSAPSASAQSSSSSSPLGALSQSISAQQLAARSHGASASPGSSWPETSSKSVAYWLLASAASVFGIVIFGGLTRLTESGLSITEWRPVTGSFPPRDEQAWEEEFARYKLSPEFKMLNSRMDLEEFKQIYWMEWTHRLWGRVVGITFVLPTVYFVARRRTSARMARRLVGICGLIGFQGFIGWWMVKSGLKDDLLETGSHPRVSQYRLTIHLGAAFVAYLAMLWNGMQILRQHRLLRDPHAGLQLLETLRSPELRAFRGLVVGLSALIFVTALSGALVAGLDAGLIYTEFPWMGQGLLPPKREMFDPFYSHTPDQGDLIWRNAFENPVLAQLDHRILATTTFCAILGLWSYSRFSPRVRALLPPEAKKGAMGLVHLASLQVVLGISTLWYLVPTPLAAAHQAGALALLTFSFLLGSRVSAPSRMLRLVQNAVKQAPKSGSAVGNRGPDALLKARLQQAS